MIMRWQGRYVGESVMVDADFADIRVPVEIIAIEDRDPFPAEAALRCGSSVIQVPLFMLKPIEEAS